jgi:methionine sulfoxide reductase heme-binding subunit
LSTTWLWYATRGAGVVSLVLLTAVVVLGVLTVARFETAGWPRFVTQGLHRNLALTSVAFLGLHVVTAVVDPFTNLGWVAAVVPFSSYYRTFWLGLGTVSMELLGAVLITSLLRPWLGHWTWRIVHWLAYASWPMAVLHTIGTGTDAWSLWLLPINAVCAVAVLTAVLYRVRIPNPDPLAAARSSFRAASGGLREAG